MLATSLKIFRCNMFRALLLLLLLWLQGCSTLPATQLPEQLTLEKIATITPDSPFAPSPDGQQIALVKNGLQLLILQTGTKIKLSPDAPLALAWHPVDNRLLTAFVAADASNLKTFRSDGKTLNQTQLSGTVSDLTWGADGWVTVATIDMKHHSFGSTHSCRLWRWNGTDPAILISRNDVTAKPRTVKLRGQQLYQLSKLSLSPFADEVLYSRLQDPPAADPYRNIILRHLQSGAERQLKHLYLTGGKALLLADDSILFPDQHGKIIQFDPWTETTIASWNSNGTRLSASATGRYLLTDGQLFSGSERITSFPAEVDGLFSSNNQLFLRYRQHLYRLSGLTADQNDPTTADQRILKLRDWRSSGLISHQEYLTHKKRLLFR